MKLVNNDHNENMLGTWTESTTENKNNKRSSSNHEIINKFCNIQIDQDVKGTLNTNDEQNQYNNNENAQIDMTVEQNKNNNNSVSVNRSNTYQLHRKY